MRFLKTKTPRKLRGVSGFECLGAYQP